MKVEVTQENLSRALQNVSRVASSRTNLPILNNILIRTIGKQLFIAATNLEIAATQKIGAKISTQGSITIPAKLITEFVGNLPKSTVQLEVKNNSITITCEAYTSVINGIKDDEFPELPEIDEKSAIHLTLKPDTFKKSVSQTIIAASGDTTRPVLTGVYCHTVDGMLFFAATDGYRLAEKQVIATKDNLTAIIPVSTLQEVIRTITDDIEEIEILFDDTQVRFRLNDSEITSRLIDGKFPDYRQLIPTSNTTTSTITTSDFVRITKIAGLFARESGGVVTINADEAKNALVIHSVASELGENTSEIAAKNSGKTGSVNLNSRYLLEVLTVIDESSVQFAFSGPLAPCILTPMAKNTDYLHIIMPIKS